MSVLDFESNDRRGEWPTVLAFAFEDFFVVLHEGDLRLHSGGVSVLWVGMEWFP